MGDRYEPDRDTQDDEQQALDEIRRLFARYRRVARHGMVTEPEEEAYLRSEEPKDAPAVAAR